MRRLIAFLLVLLPIAAHAQSFPNATFNTANIQTQLLMLNGAKLGLGNWTTSARPLSPVGGVMGFNVTLQEAEVWSGTNWVAMSAVPFTGGSVPNATAFGSTVSVAGLTTLAGGAGVTGGLTTDTLGATGNSTVGGTLGVTGATNLLGGATVGPSGTGFNTASGTPVTFTSGAGNLTWGAGLLTVPNINVGNNRTLTSSTTLTPADTHALTLTGTVTTGNLPSPWLWSVGGDTVAANNSQKAIVGLNFIHNFGGSSAMIGSRFAATFQAGLQGNSPTVPSTGNRAAGTNPFYGTANFWLTVNGNDGGTNDTLTGAWSTATVMNPQVVLGPNATHWLEANTGEANIAVQTGASVARKFGYKITPLPTDAVQGTISDAAFKFGGAIGSVGWKTGILFGGDISQWTMPGTVIKAEYSSQQSGTPNTSVWGVDFLEDAFSGGAFRSPGFSVGGDAKVKIGTALLTPNGASLSLDTSGSVLNTSSLNAAGSACEPGDILTFGNDGRAIVNTISGSAVATYTVLNKPYDWSGSPPVTLAATAYPTSPGPCSGVVFNVTWTTGTTLALGPTSATAVNIGRSGQNTTVEGLLNLPGIVTAANCTAQPSKSVIAITGTGVLQQCP